MNCTSIYYFIYLKATHQSDKHNQTSTNDFQLVISPYQIALITLQCCLDFACYQRRLIDPIIKYYLAENIQHKILQITFDILDYLQCLLQK